MAHLRVVLSLPATCPCINSSCVRATLTIGLPARLRREVERAAKAQGVSESEFIRRAVQHELWSEAFNRSRQVLVPKGRAKGAYTDEDVFKIVS